MSLPRRAGTMLTAPRLRAKRWAVRYGSEPIARVLIALHVSANAVTVAGLGVAGLSAYLIAEGNLLAGGAVLLGGASMDMLDGAVARLTNTVSRFGAFLDSVIDRLGEAAALFGILVFFVRDGHELGAYLSFGALTMSLMVSYSRARAEGLGVEGDVGFLGRPERIVVLGVGLLAGVPLYALGVIVALGGLTVAQRMVYVWRRTHDA